MRMVRLVVVGGHFAPSLAGISTRSGFVQGKERHSAEGDSVTLVSEPPGAKLATNSSGGWLTHERR